MGRASWFGFAIAACLAAGCWATHDPSSRSGPIGEWPGAGGAGVRPVDLPTTPPSVGSGAAGSSPTPTAPPTAPNRPLPPSRPPSRPGSAGAGATGSLPGNAGTFASGGRSGAAAIGGGGIGGSAGMPGIPASPIIPEPTQPCPMLATGTTFVRGSEVLLWVGPRSNDRQGPLLLYWPGSGDAAAETMSIGPTAMQEILGAGGVVATIVESSGAGMPTALGWRTGDFEVADEIVACASRQLNIDPRRIYSLGSVGGGQQASAMAFLRSGYVAAVVSNAGGLRTDWPPPAQGALPAVLSIYPEATTASPIDFAPLSQKLCDNITAFGGFATECAYPGDITEAPLPLIEAAWRFLIDHPYGVKPPPYVAGLPAVFPEYCQIVR